MSLRSTSVSSTVRSCDMTVNKEHEILPGSDFSKYSV
jgi:hypothetical protein